MHSSLYLISSFVDQFTGLPLARGVILGQFNGLTVVHGEPGAAIPEGATVIRDGQTVWKWCHIANEHPELLPVINPHEWAGERTACRAGCEAFAAAKPEVELGD